MTLLELRLLGIFEARDKAGKPVEVSAKKNRALLRQQPGFQDEIAFVVPGGTEAVSISVWDQQADAEAYARGTYPQVLQAVANVLEGTPQVDTYAVSNSTFHKIAARVAV